MQRPLGLARKHALVWSLLVSGLLAASGIGAAFLAYRDTLRSVEELQREKAAAAAARIADSIAGIEQPLRWLATSPSLAQASTEELRVELLQWLKRVPALSDLRWIDADGRERLWLSRFALDQVESWRDCSKDAWFLAARRTGEYVGPVHFFRDTEPHLLLALGGSDGPVVASEVNLKFIWEVIAQVRHGETGVAYVVDGRGRLLSHPDLSLVLRRTDMAQLPQVRAAISSDGVIAAHARNLDDVAVLAAAAPIERLGWWVIAEQQRREALAPVARSLAQSAALIALGVLIAVSASVALARRLVRPIQRLQSRAAAIGAGRFDERIDIDTGDELQELAQQFERMATDLREIYATLEARIAARTRELAHANEAKSRFLAAASHDLRQPMHALGLFVGQLRSAETDAARGKLIGNIEESVGALNALLESLLDISRLDAGAVAVNRRPFAVGPMLARLATSFAPAAQTKGLELRARPTRAWVDSDPLLLERIVINLLANAVRYTERGRVLIGCRRAGARVDLIVADTGIGISAEHLPNVFREFYQVGGRGGEGLGLGLAIVDRLARLLDHPVTVRSERGRGTCFLVSLPRVEPQSEEAPAEEAGAAEPLAGRRILVIDDDAAIREAMGAQLAQWGCDALLAADADAALAAIRARGSPDLVLVDLRLAGDDGLAVARRVLEACGRKVPIAIVTGETAPQRLRQAEASGWPMLSKPIRPARLRALLEQMLRAS